MATKSTSIWTEARSDAAKRAKTVKKENRRMKRQSVLDGPLSILKLITILMVIYSLFQYVPAFLNIKKIISQANAQSSAQAGAQTLVENRENWGLMAPLRDYAKLRKAYVRKGQSIQLQYVLPSKAIANVTIKQCKAIPFVEVFNCEVVQSETIDLSGETTGTRRFQVSSSAIYLLESQVQVGEDDRFDITWRRN